MDAALLEDLRAEEAALDDLLASLDDADWYAPTPAEGWTVADTVRHLAVAERAATASVRDGVDFAAASSSAAATRGIGTTDAAMAPVLAPADQPAELLAAWRSARRSTLDALAIAPGDARVPWGGRLMGVRSLATARLMETWAHGLDCFAAAGVAPVDTDRLRHIAWLGWRTLPFAFARSREEPPAPIEQLRIEVIAPSGAVWAFGSSATSRAGLVQGSASTWCRVVTQRWRASEPPPLSVSGALAAAAVRVAQAYLDA